ncbi:hypothetical protein PHLCEN_2v1524 [Hermanssonia centrifuga]|uniref:Uncharacterized protein n=1 Tax=Hermanssonia centrifuga TaxID=98765 RepID=A0A2R6RZT9_9APHY|nr:hypothetical protein PHLCEN_2v1524 [Hermanssonia centrifuga]
MDHACLCCSISVDIHRVELDEISATYTEVNVTVSYRYPDEGKVAAISHSISHGRIIANYDVMPGVSGVK